MSELSRWYPLCPAMSVNGTRASPATQLLDGCGQASSWAHPGRELAIPPSAEAGGTIYYACPALVTGQRMALDAPHELLWPCTILMVALALAVSLVWLTRSRLRRFSNRTGPGPLKMIRSYEPGRGRLPKTTHHANSAADSMTLFPAPASRPRLQPPALVRADAAPLTASAQPDCWQLEASSRWGWGSRRRSGGFLLGFLRFMACLLFFTAGVAEAQSCAYTSCQASAVSCNAGEYTF